MAAIKSGAVLSLDESGKLPVFGGGELELFAMIIV